MIFKFRSIFIPFFIAFCFNSFVIAKLNEVACESIDNYAFYWGSPYSGHSLKTCLMLEKTKIDETNVKISTSDESMLGIQLSNNKKVFHLPIDIAEKFPYLLGYDAEHCSVREISEHNFKGLGGLRVLYLFGNQIEEIPARTFKDLSQLEYLGLSKNSP